MQWVRHSFIALSTTISIGSYALALECNSDHWNIRCTGTRDQCVQTIQSGTPQINGVHADAQPFVLLSTPRQTQRSVVLVHGIGGSPSAVRELAERFQAQGYNVVAPLLTGHGTREQDLTRSGLAACWQSDVHNAARLAGQLGESVEAAGHSTGGALLTLESMKRHGTRFSRLLLFDPALNFSGPSGTAVANSCSLQYFTRYDSSAIDLLSVFENTLGSSCSTYRVFQTDFYRHLYQSACDANSASNQTPHYDLNQVFIYDRVATSGFCELSKIQSALRRYSDSACRRLPETAVMFSDDQFIWNNMSREDILRQLCSNRPAGSPPLRTFETRPGTFHGVMQIPSCNSELDRLLTSLFSSTPAPPTVEASSGRR